MSSWLLVSCLLSMICQSSFVGGEGEGEEERGERREEREGGGDKNESLSGSKR